LDRPFVLLGRFARIERAEIPAAPGARIHFPRIQAIPAVGELSDHAVEQAKRVPVQIAAFRPAPGRFRIDGGRTLYKFQSRRKKFQPGTPGKT
jgi:hypothetical protein